MSLPMKFSIHLTISQSLEWHLSANPLEMDVTESRIIKTNGNLWGPEHME